MHFEREGLRSECLGPRNPDTEEVVVLEVAVATVAADAADAVDAAVAAMVAVATGVVVATTAAAATLVAAAAGVAVAAAAVAATMAAVGRVSGKEVVEVHQPGPSPSSSWGTFRQTLLKRSFHRSLAPMAR